jgi:hypothetical protein
MKNLIICRIYTSPYVFSVIRSRRMKWEGHVGCAGTIISSFKSLVENHEGKRPNGKHRYRWTDNIKMDIKKAVTI